MRFLKRLFIFYIFSNIHVALAGFAMAAVTIVKYDIKSHISAYFVLLSIIVSYNFIRFYEIQSHRLEWFYKWFYKNKIKLLLLCVMAFVGMIYLVFFTSFNFTSIFILLPFAFITFFYVIPVFKLGNVEFSFRNFPFIKIISIAFSWAGVTVFFPIKEANMMIDNGVCIEFLQRFLLLLAITIPFDIRDIYSDSKKIRTLPQVIGIVNSKIIGSFLLCFFIGLEFFKQDYFYPVATVAIAVITLFFLWSSSEKKSRFYTSFWVEAIPIFWWLLWFL